MDNEFLNHVYNTCHIISISKLINNEQGYKESIIDYINRWHTLTLKCKDQLPKCSAGEMCAQGVE